MDFDQELEQILAQTCSTQDLGSGVYEKIIRYAVRRLGAYLNCKLIIEEPPSGDSDRVDFHRVIDFNSTFATGIDIKLRGLIAVSDSGDPPGLVIGSTVFLYADGVRVVRSGSNQAFVGLEYVPNPLGGYWRRFEWESDDYGEWSNYSEFHG